MAKNDVIYTVCSYCGKQIKRKGMKVCPNCGEKLVYETPKVKEETEPNDDEEVTDVPDEIEDEEDINDTGDIYGDDTDDLGDTDDGIEDIDFNEDVVSLDGENNNEADDIGSTNEDDDDLDPYEDFDDFDEESLAPEETPSSDENDGAEDDFDEDEIFGDTGSDDTVDDTEGITEPVETEESDTKQDTWDDGSTFEEDTSAIDEALDDFEDFDDDEPEPIPPKKEQAPVKKPKVMPTSKNPASKREPVKPQGRPGALGDSVKKKKQAAPEKVYRKEDVYDPNHDGYYDDILAKVDDVSYKIPKDIIFKGVFVVLAVLTSIVYLIFNV